MNLATITKYVNRIRPGSPAKLHVPYGDRPRMLLDVYGNSGDEPKPVIMFWHGGSWAKGDKGYYQFVADYLERIGALVVVVGYPLYPQQTFPGFIDDAKQAVAWVKANIAEFGGNPDRIFTMGHSAGAHTAVITTLQDEAGDISGCISFAAPCTLRRSYWEPVFGVDNFDHGLQNPINHIGPNKHKFLLVHGKTDHIVIFLDGKRLYRALKKADYPVKLISLQLMGHMRLLTTIIRPFAYRYKVGREIKSFIHEA